MTPGVAASERRPIMSWLHRVLAKLPRRASAPGYAMLRRRELRNRTGSDPAAPIAVLATHDLSLSGAPRVVLEIARVLRDHGYRLIVITMADGAMRRAFEELGATVLVDRLPHAAAPYLNRLARTADIAICNTVVTAPLVTALAPHVPTLWYLHEVSLLQERMAAGALDVPFARAARVWGGSEICAAIVRDVRPDIRVVPYGLAPIGDTPAPGGAGPLRVGIFGSIEPRKGQDLLIEGLDLLPADRRAQLDVRIYGRVLDPGFARPILAAAATDTQLFYGGELDGDAYRRAMLDVDAVMVCSRDDTLPLVSLDALGCRRLLLLLPGVGTTQWMTDGVDALIGADTSASAVADLLERALLARDRAGEIGAAARATFDRHFSEAAFARRLMAEVASLVDRAELVDGAPASCVE